MNYTFVNEAYKIHHINSDTYTENIKYRPICIYCNNMSSKPLMNDGSFRKCDRCNKHFKSIAIGNAIKNFSYSTDHLKGTN